MVRLATAGARTMVGSFSRFFLLCIAFAAPCAAQDADWRLSSGRAGKVHVGMPVESLYTVFGYAHVRAIAQFDEGEFSVALQVYEASDPGRPILLARINELCGSYYVTGIEALSPQFRTSTGVGAGSTAGAVRRAHPEARHNLEHHPSLIVSSLSMTFMLPTTSAADSVPVVKVWTWGSLPAHVRQACR